MAERTLTVRLTAIADGYTRVLDDAARRTENFASRAGKVTAWGDKAEQTGKKLSYGLTLPIVGAGTAVLAMAGNFERSMREVQALTGASSGEMSMLSEQAKKMGADTQFSASQAADAMGQLIKGGFTARQTYDALPGVMQLAAAASLDIASAADIATNVLSGFGLQVSDLATVNDYLAQTANASDTDVRELGEAFKYVGPVAKGAGLSLEETTATLGLFAENGIRGEMAGTALRGALTALLSPSGKAAGILADLGINAIDANGKMRPMVDVLDQLAGSGATTGQIMEIFGDRAGPAMVALLGQGSGALRKFTAMLEESGGVAQNLADSKMGGLLGSWEQFKGSVETLAISLGNAGLASLFTGLAQGAASLTDGIAGLPVGVQRTGLAVAGLAAASGPAIWALGKLSNLYKPVVEGIGSVIGKLQGMRVQLALAQMDGVGAGKALLGMFGPQAALLVGLAALAGAFWFARKRAEEFESSHKAAGDAAAILAESAGITLSSLDSMAAGQERAVVSADDFRRANEDAIVTLRTLGDTADQQAYLREIGYQFVLRGASPEQAMEQVKKLADAAGVEVPVTLTVSNVGEFAGQVDAAVTRAKRVAARGLKIRDISLEPDSGMKADLDSIARAATDAFKTDNVAGFIQILGKAESTLGRNARAVNYLSDQAAKYSEVSGMNVTTTGDLVGVMEDLTAGSSGASQAQRDLLERIRSTASEMDGGLTPKNLAAAAAMETAGMKAQDYGDKVKGAGDAAAGAAGGVDGLGGELDEQAQKAKEAEDAFKSYLDTLRGATDPMFAVVDAFRSNSEANHDLLTAYAELDKAVAEHGRGSQEAIDAQANLDEAHMRAARSAQDVMVAAQEMQYAIEHNTMSVDGAKQMLVEWASQGLISAATAEQLAAEFDAAAVKAQAQADSTNASHGALKNLDGTTAATKVTMDTSDFDAGMARIMQAIQSGGWFGTILFGGGKPKGGGKAAGGSLYPGLPTLVGEHGPELVTLAGHQPGWVTPADQTRAMLTPARPAGTFVPAGPAPAPQVDLAVVAEKFTTAALATRPIMGDYHVHTPAPPSSPAELARAAKFAKALVA